MCLPTPDPHPRLRPPAAGLPAGPAGALGAVEGGSWLAALSGLVVLALQWQTYGYIPSALPDSNCFGAEAGSTARSLPATATNAAASRQLPATPSASGVDTTKVQLLGCAAAAAGLRAPRALRA